MKNRTDKFLSKLFFAFCIVIGVLSLEYINNQNRWSPIDEYAHMDYIEKMELGVFPKISDTVVTEITDHILSQPEHCVGGPFQSYSQLGFSINSYQAKHPPFYYILLVLPNKILKHQGAPIFERLKTLRIISYLLFIAGTFMAFPIVNLLRRMHYKIPRYYTWLFILFSMLICITGRYGLGNNFLSPLIINTTVYFLLKYCLYSLQRDLWIAVFLLCLSVFTALTNILIAPFFLLLFIKKGIKSFSLKELIISGGIILSFVLFFLYWKTVTIPDKKFEEIMYSFIGFNLPAGYLDFNINSFLFLHDTFKISFIKEGLNLTWAYLSLLAINLIFSFIFFRRMRKQHHWIILAYFIFFGFIFEFYFLNEYVGVVTWVAFRHYLGFIPILFISFTGSLFLLNEKGE